MRRTEGRTRSVAQLIVSRSLIGSLDAEFIAVIEVVISVLVSPLMWRGHDECIVCSHCWTSSRIAHLSSQRLHSSSSLFISSSLLIVIPFDSTVSIIQLVPVHRCMTRGRLSSRRSLLLLSQMQLGISVVRLCRMIVLPTKLLLLLMMMVMMRRLRMSILGSRREGRLTVLWLQGMDSRGRGSRGRYHASLQLVLVVVAGLARRSVPCWILPVLVRRVLMLLLLRGRQVATMSIGRGRGRRIGVLVATLYLWRSVRRGSGWEGGQQGLLGQVPLGRGGDHGLALLVRVHRISGGSSSGLATIVVQVEVDDGRYGLLWWRSGRSRSCRGCRGCSRGRGRDSPVPIAVRSLDPCLADHRSGSWLWHVLSLRCVLLVVVQLLLWREGLLLHLRLLLLLHEGLLILLLWRILSTLHE